MFCGTLGLCYRFRSSTPCNFVLSATGKTTTKFKIHTQFTLNASVPPGACPSFTCLHRCYCNSFQFYWITGLPTDHKKAMHFTFLRQTKLLWSLHCQNCGSHQWHNTDDDADDNNNKLSRYLQTLCCDLRFMQLSHHEMRLISCSAVKTEFSQLVRSGSGETSIQLTGARRVIRQWQQPPDRFPHFVLALLMQNRYLIYCNGRSRGTRAVSSCVFLCLRLVCLFLQTDRDCSVYNQHFVSSKSINPASRSYFLEKQLWDLIRTMMLYCS
jgi:hypothetical protein